MRVLAAVYHAILRIVAPAEGEEWLVGLAVGLLLLGAARHRLEPWLAGVATDPPVAAEARIEAGASAAATPDSSVTSMPAPAAALPAAVRSAITPIEPASFGRVDVNRATAEELETLPRIGPALAQRIIADREANGPFATIADLDRVKGIGPATLEALAGDVVIGSAAGRASGTTGADGTTVAGATGGATAAAGPAGATAAAGPAGATAAAGPAVGDSTRPRHGAPPLEFATPRAE